MPPNRYGPLLKMQSCWKNKPDSYRRYPKLEESGKQPKGVALNKLLIMGNSLSWGE
jgi:hypothetical protein